MKAIHYFTLALVIAGFTACGGGYKDSYTTTLTVASQQRDCVGVAPQKCFLVKQEDQKHWEFFYSPIENFDYKPGYEYVIKVRVHKKDNPPMDVSSLSYSLEKVVSAEAKESEDMLPSVPLPAM